jgi:hypothetical protein
VDASCACLIDLSPDSYQGQTHRRQEIRTYAIVSGAPPKVFPGTEVETEIKIWTRAEIALDPDISYALAGPAKPRQNLSVPSIDALTVIISSKYS